jgi:hypothetical protein
MSTDNHIQKRHHRDRVKDALFIGVAILIAGIAIGSVTTKAQGRAPQWGVVMVEQPSRLDPSIQNPAQPGDTVAATDNTNE